MAVTFRLSWARLLNSKSFNLHIVSTMFANLLISVIALATGPLAARLLGPEGRGELAAIQAWPTFLATIGLLGLPQAIVYFSSRNPKKTGQYLTSAMYLAFVVSVPLTIVGYILMPTLMSAQSAHIANAARWYLFYIFVQIFVGMLVTPLQGQNDLFLWNILRVTPNITWLAVLSVAFVVDRNEPTWIAGAYLAGLGLLFFPRFLIIRRRTEPDTWKPTVKMWRPMLGYGLPVVAADIPSILNLRLDQMVMVSLLSTQMLGYYVVAVAWGAASTPLITAIGQVMFSHVAAKESVDSRQRLIVGGTRIAILLGLALAIPLCFITPIAVPTLFGYDFMPAIPAAVVLIVANAVLAINVVLKQSIQGLGKPRLILWSETISLFTTACFLWLLLPSLGITGAALTSLLAYAVGTVFLAWKVSCLTPLSIADILLPRLSDLRSIWSAIYKIRHS